MQRNRQPGDPPAGALYRLDPDLTVERLEGGIGVSNGPCFSPDGGTFYFNDSQAGTVSAYLYDTAHGRPAGKRILVTRETLGGAPDGMTVDAAGNLWVAVPRTGTVACVSPDGAVLRRIAVPCPQVSSVMFGGPGLDVLFATSIGRPLSAGGAPSEADGGLYRVDGLGVKGLVEPRFAS